MKIAGPNGLVIDTPESIATAMVGDGSRGYRFVSEDEKPSAPAPVKRAPGRPRKKPTA